MRRQVAAALALCLLASSGASAARADAPPVRLLDLNPYLGREADLSVTVVDAQGRSQPFRRMFDGRRPVLLTMNYFRCRALCDLQLRGLARALRTLRYKPGQQYRLITLTFDPGDGPAVVRAKARELDAAVGGRHAWTVLRASAPDVAALARSIGFAYEYDAKTRQYAHAPLVAVLSGTGRITRYLEGVEYAARDLQLALIEADRGQVARGLQAVLLSCFEFDALTGRYSLAVLRLVRTGGVLTLLGLVTFAVWSTHARKRRERSAARP